MGISLNPLVDKRTLKPELTLTPKELGFLMDSEFLTVKAGILKKVESILQNTEKELVKTIKQIDSGLPEETLVTSGKISRGENYKLLPYLVLDYPRLNTLENLLLFRTIFWWGNYFSYTLHLDGKIGQKVMKWLLNDAGKLQNQNLYIYKGKDKWSHDLSDSGYVLIDSLNSKQLERILKEQEFLKISAKSSLKDYDIVTESSVKYLRFFLSLLEK